MWFLGSLLQKVSEKVGGAEGTKLDDDFTEMEKARLNPPHPGQESQYVLLRCVSSHSHLGSPVSPLPEGGHHVPGSVGHHDQDHRVPAAEPR